MSNFSLWKLDFYRNQASLIQVYKFNDSLTLQNNELVCFSLLSQSMSFFTHIPKEQSEMRRDFVNVSLAHQRPPEQCYQTSSYMNSSSSETQGLFAAFCSNIHYIFKCITGNEPV